jgi:prepilin-type N-terminal cleavage/methylation domain-containing protein
LNSEDLEIGKRCQNISVEAGRLRAFTLVELLVAIAIISMLMAILMPALSGVRRQATALLGMRNQREVANAVNLFAMDNDDLYPQSVATVGVEDSWNWREPTQMAGEKSRSPQLHRSMSAYLHSYIASAKTVSCPGAPQPYKYLQESWDAGDDWDNPDTDPRSDPVGGTFCFYWNYTGYVGGPRAVFKGPRGPASGGTQSQLLISDYLGYGYWRSPENFTSCERLAKADILEEYYLAPALWATKGDPNAVMPKIKLRAAYTDGHVETYTPSDVVPMRIAMTPEGVPPFPDEGASKGIFYIPRHALP